jgi:hypothetical protein
VVTSARLRDGLPHLRIGVAALIEDPGPTHATRDAGEPVPPRPQTMAIDGIPGPDRGNELTAHA